MSALLDVLLAMLGLAVAAYAHLRLPRFIAGAAGIALTRICLLLAGAGYAYVMGQARAGESAFDYLAWFGFVHVPAAAILFLKAQRGSGRT